MRRVNIPKPDGTTRALGIPTGPDKLLQEVIRMILEAYYEPQFSDHSHGFRPIRGCHTALRDVDLNWTGVRWFVEGDIKGCFDNIDHDVVLSVLGEKPHDNRFLRLLMYLQKAGYPEDWKYGRTLISAPIPPTAATSPKLRRPSTPRLLSCPAKRTCTSRRRILI